jgi:hypothetical protein
MAGLAQNHTEVGERSEGFHLDKRQITAEARRRRGKLKGKSARELANVWGWAELKMSS